MSIWDEVQGKKYTKQIDLSIWRMVEDQSKSTTRKYVRTTQEHDLLEQLIESSKPAIKRYGDEQYLLNLHYLLFTPFRYPPLRWGSRFGMRSQRGILYGSMALKTAMSEKAFYKLAFLRASDGNIGGKTVPYTAFKVKINAERFVDLCHEPFATFKPQISNKTTHEFSQALGTQMRHDEIESLQYFSARCSNAGLNVAVFTPKVLQHNQQIENTFEHFECFATKQVVEFSPKARRVFTKDVFDIEEFLVDGKMPIGPVLI